MTLDEARARIGDGVVYHPAGCDCPGGQEGTITSVNDRWVFVRYGSARTSQATDPADLELLAAPPPRAFTHFPPESGMDDQAAEDNGIAG